MSTPVVYGHPASTPEGGDGYFGDLMIKEPQLHRVLHVDCARARARALEGGGRTFSLHAWGRPLFALAALPFQRWRPAMAEPMGENHWLVRR